MRIKLLLLLHATDGIFKYCVQLKSQYEKRNSIRAYIKKRFQGKRHRKKKQQQQCSKSLPFCFPITQINHKVLCARSFVADSFHLVFSSWFFPPLNWNILQ